MIRLKSLLEQTYTQTKPGVVSKKISNSNPYSKPKSGIAAKKIKTPSPIKNTIANIFDFMMSPIYYMYKGGGYFLGKATDAEKRGVKIYNNLVDIVQRRLEYNKKNKLPINTPTKEEIAYRKKLYKSTPSYGYPKLTQMFDIVNNIEQGKMDRTDVNILNNIEKELKSSNPVDRAYGKKDQQKYNARLELKAMALGIDTVDGLSKGYWIKSEFSPQKKADGKTTIYIRPKDIPTLTTKQFDVLYNEILLTKEGDKFPGGNSDTIRHRIGKLNIFWKHTERYPETLSSATFWNKFMTLGLKSFKFGCGEKNGTSFISVYDLWDLAPDFYSLLLKKGYAGNQQGSIDLSQFLHAPEIYFRIYRPEPGKSIVPFNPAKYSKDGKVKK